MQFKEDVESAMQRKPNHGFYKNLSDMMHTKMEMLSDEVGTGIAKIVLFILLILISFGVIKGSLITDIIELNNSCIFIFQLRFINYVGIECNKITNYT